MTVRYKRKVKKCRTAFNVNQIGRQGRKLIADNLFHGNINMILLRSALLFDLRGMAAYQHYARVQGAFADYRSLCDEVRNKIWR